MSTQLKIPNPPAPHTEANEETRSELTDAINSASPSALHLYTAVTHALPSLSRTPEVLDALTKLLDNIVAMGQNDRNSGNEKDGFLHAGSNRYKKVMSALELATQALEDCRENQPIAMTKPVQELMEQLFRSK